MNNRIPYKLEERIQRELEPRERVEWKEMSFLRKTLLAQSAQGHPCIAILEFATNKQRLTSARTQTIKCARIFHPFSSCTPAHFLAGCADVRRHWG